VGETSLESSELQHGLFTHFLLEGLGGAEEAMIVTVQERDTAQNERAEVQKQVEGAVVQLRSAAMVNHSLKEENSSYVECNCRAQCAIIYGMEIETEHVELMENGNCLCRHPEKDFFVIETDESCPEYGLFTRSVVEIELDKQRQRDLIAEMNNSEA